MVQCWLKQKVKQTSLQRFSLVALQQKMILIPSRASRWERWTKAKYNALDLMTRRVILADRFMLMNKISASSVSSESQKHRRKFLNCGINWTRPSSDVGWATPVVSDPWIASQQENMKVVKTEMATCQWKQSMSVCFSDDSILKVMHAKVLWTGLIGMQSNSHLERRSVPLGLLPSFNFPFTDPLL